MKNVKIKNVPISFCPTCNYEMDSATSVELGPIEPSSGDLSVCLNCGEKLMFNDILVCKKLPDDLILDFETAEILEKASKIIRERGRIKI